MLWRSRINGSSEEITGALLDASLRVGYDFTDRVSAFLSANRMYEVLGLFVLFIVGVMLVSEGGHLAHIKLYGYAVEPMAKSTFYFVLVVLLLVDFVQSRYQRKLMAQKVREIDAPEITTTKIDASQA